MTPTFRDKATEMLIRDEGLRLNLYHCSKGKLTIGVGRNIEDNGISKATAMQMLDEDIQSSYLSLSHLFGAEKFDAFTENRKLALLNMIFNLGERRFIGFVKLIRAVRAGDWVTAAEESLNSKWAHQVDDGPGGKIGRADRVAEMLRYD